MRLLIYGAGVIGSLYARLLWEAGFDVTLYARGRRLHQLQTNGLCYYRKGRLCRADVPVTGRLAADDVYDFILLTVREDQLHAALGELRSNKSPTIVTMVNSLEHYETWERICGTDRILPAFPGAGGSLENGILDAALTPRLVQPTTISGKDGQKTGRVRTFARILHQADIPYQTVPDMHIWQLCHLAMVVPIADAYYEAADPEHAGEDQALMRLTARRLRRNFRRLSSMGLPLSPRKLTLFRDLPLPLLQFGLSAVYKSSFGNIFMYRHAMKAPDEMRSLHEQLYRYLRLRSGNRR